MHRNHPHPMTPCPGTKIPRQQRRCRGPATRQATHSAHYTRL